MISRSVDMADNQTLFIAESEDFDQVALEVLRRDFNVILGDGSRDHLLGEIANTDVLWVRLRFRMDTQTMDSAPKLRAIATATTGLNHIDLNAAAQRKIAVLSLKGETDFLRSIRATAEHTIALMLVIMRRLPAAIDHVRNGGWNRDRFKGHELVGKRVGIVGHGRLGRLVAGYLQAFGCDVVACDPDPVEPPEVPLVSLDDLLASCDIVSLHVNLDAGTEGFFDAGCFRSMRKGAWLVNTARGELVDEVALLEALRSGSIAGAALDVLAAEESRGMALHPLVSYAREHENLVITPHIGGATFESMASTERFLAEKLIGAKSKIFSS